MEFVPRYIKTSGNATVDHLSKYLAVRLALEELRRNADASPVNMEAASEKQYTIYIPTPGNQFTVSLLRAGPVRPKQNRSGIDVMMAALSKPAFCSRF